MEEVGGGRERGIGGGIEEGGRERGEGESVFIFFAFSEALSGLQLK